MDLDLACESLQVLLQIKPSRVGRTSQLWRARA